MSGDVSPSQAQSSGAGKAQADQQAGAQAVSRIAGSGGLAGLLVDKPDAKQLAKIEQWIDAAKPAQLAVAIPQLTTDELVAKLWTPLTRSYPTFKSMARVLLYATPEQQAVFGKVDGVLPYDWLVDSTDLERLHRFLPKLSPKDQLQAVLTLRPAMLTRLRALEGKGPHAGDDLSAIDKATAVSAGTHLTWDPNSKSGGQSPEEVHGRLDEFSPELRSKLMREISQQPGANYDATKLFLGLSPAEQQPFIGSIIQHPNLANEVLSAIGFQSADSQQLAATWRTLPAPVRAQVLKIAFGETRIDADWKLKLFLMATPADRQPYVRRVDLTTEAYSALSPAEQQELGVNAISKDSATQEVFSLTSGKTGLPDLDAARAGLQKVPPAVRTMLMSTAIHFPADESVYATTLFLALSPTEQQPFMAAVLKNPKLGNDVGSALGMLDESANAARLSKTWLTLPTPVRAQVLKLMFAKIDNTTLPFALIATPSERHPYLGKILGINDEENYSWLNASYLPRLRALGTEFGNESFLPRTVDTWRQRHLAGHVESTLKARQDEFGQPNDEIDSNKVLPANLTDPRELRRQFDATNDPNRMRALAQRRFGIQFNHMDANGMRRAWATLESLPRTDVLVSKRMVGDTNARTLLEKVALEGEWEGDRMAVKSHDDAKTFDHAVRHEVGHAVDQQLRISDTYGKTILGGWREHEDPNALARELAQGSQGVIAHMHDAHKRAEALHWLAQLISGEKSTGAFARPLLRLEGLNPWSPAHDPAFHAVLAGSDTINQALIGNYSNLPDIGGRCYRRVAGNQWVSYAAAATKHKVSDYQFFSPKEWFAEAYAAFYDPKYPDPTKDNELKRHDPATNDFFLKHVHLHTHAPRPDDPVG